MKTKIIVITGGSKGLGLEIINQLYQNVNYQVATISRNIKEKNCHYLLQFKGDITQTKDREKFIEKVIRKWGKIDILINNAGMLGEFKSIESYTEEEVNRIIDLNIKGTFLTTQLVIKSMISYNNSTGYIINIGSTRSITGAPNKSLYSMTKFALRGLTQCINAEYKDRGIYSTIVCPGSFSTVSIKDITNIIKQIIELPKESNIPEIIIGGQL